MRRIFVVFVVGPSCTIVLSVPFAAAGPLYVQGPSFLRGAAQRFRVHSRVPWDFLFESVVCKKHLFIVGVHLGRYFWSG